MNPKNSKTHNGTNPRRHESDGVLIALSRYFFCALVIALLSGCGMVTVHHVPKLGALSGEKLADLHGTQPIEVKGGDCATGEIKIGTAGMGKVMGDLSQWTTVVVGTIQTNLQSRGATISPGAAKVLTVTMASAELNGNPLTGFTKGTTKLTATGSSDLNLSFEGSNHSMAPLSAMDGAIEEAVKKLLTDPAIETYLRK